MEDRNRAIQREVRQGVRRGSDICITICYSGERDVSMAGVSMRKKTNRRPADASCQKAIMSLDARFNHPPAIARSLGFHLVDSGNHTATIEIVTDIARHANPMGTVHGGVLCDVADAAIGWAHATGLSEGESFTSLDLQINFFRPVWNDRLRAIAKPVHLGKTVSRYVCDILNSEGKLVAQVTSTVMTLSGEKATGR